MNEWGWGILGVLIIIFGIIIFAAVKTSTVIDFQIPKTILLFKMLF